MSADIVNLNRARKQRSRTKKAEDAAANRAYFGQSRAAREATMRAQEVLDRSLDGHRLGPTDEDAP